MSIYIPISQCVGTNLAAPNPPKKITSQKGEAYTRTYLQNNYGTPAKPSYNEALFELKICKGKIKRNKKNAIKLNLTITDEEDIKGLVELSKGFAYCVAKHKYAFGQGEFDPAHPSGLRKAYFYPSTEDGKPIEGASPLVSLKMNEKTKFKLLEPKVDAEGNPVLLPDGTPDIVEKTVDPAELVDKQVDASVIFAARDLYHSTGMPLPQLFVRSCMILSMTDSGEVEHTKSEMVQQYLKQNPELLNTLAEQIAKDKLRKNEKASLLDSGTNVKGSSTPGAHTPGAHTPAPAAQGALPTVQLPAPTSGASGVGASGVGASGAVSPAPVSVPLVQSMSTLSIGTPGGLPTVSVAGGIPSFPSLPGSGPIDLTALLNQQAAGAPQISLQKM